MQGGIQVTALLAVWLWHNVLVHMDRSSLVVLEKASFIVALTE